VMVSVLLMLILGDTLNNYFGVIENFFRDD